MKIFPFKVTPFFLALSGLLSCEAKSQYNTASDNKSLLWEVSGNGLQKPTYVYGTMHLLCASDAQLSDNLKSIINKSDQIYFEIDMDDLSQMLSGFQMGLMRHDTTLHQLYTPEEYERIRNFFDKHGMALQLQLLNRMQPMLISALVYQAILPCKETDGIEMNIMQVAHQQKKEIKGLETAAFQASLIDKIPYADQAKELLNGIDSLQEEASETEEMIQIYKDQDLDKLLDYSLKSDGGSTPELQDMMIYQRNRNWAAQFPEIAKDKQLLIAVGAGHLGGDKGLLNLLKEKGYSLRPIENK